MAMDGDEDDEDIRDDELMKKYEVRIFYCIFSILSHEELVTIFTGVLRSI